MHVEVEDTGIGISESAVEIIFEEFRQASEGLSRIHEGTGLGLTIAKKYIDLLGGRIAVKSKPGKGTIFSFDIPLSVSKQEGLAAPKQMSDRKK